MAFRNPINSLPASAITGTISAGQLGVGGGRGPARAAGAATAAKMAANSVTTASLAAGAITGQTITGGTIIGATIETSASGQRVVMSGASDELQVYDNTGTQTSYVGGPYGLVVNLDGGEYSALGNGSVYVGLGDPSTNPSGLALGGLLGVNGSGSAMTLQSPTTTATATATAFTTQYQSGAATAATGSAGAPHSILGFFNIADQWITGNLVKASTSTNAPIGWTTPALGSGWANTAVRGSGVLRYRYDCEDNIIIAGSINCTSASPATSSVMTVGGLVPKAPYPFPIVHDTAAGGLVDICTGYLSTAGVLEIFSAGTITSGDIFSFLATIPLGNLT
jgi:hypothetical protein